MTRILILMSHTGGGHRSVSLAIAEALRRMRGNQIAPQIVDVFNLERLSFLDRVTRLYSPVTRYCPRLYGWAFHLMNTAWGYEKLFLPSSRNLVPKLRRLVDKTLPDAVINTHPLCNHALVKAVEQGAKAVPILATVTELVTVHRSWVEDGIPYYTTATDEATEAVCRLGAASEQVRQLGLPVRLDIAEMEKPIATIRQDLRLEPDKPTFLVVGGGEGSGRLDRLVRAIDRQDLAAQLIVVCGRNNQLRCRLERAALRMPHRILGFVDNMPELLHAADIVVMKGGPQSVAEAIAAGKPIIVTQTLPGQEEGNAEWVERHGVGYDGRHLDRALKALRRLYDAPSERERMARNAQDAAHPDAAWATASLVLDLVGRKANPAANPK